MKPITSLVLTLALFGGAASRLPAAVLLVDNFNAATANTFDLNVEIGRQTGTLAPLTYTMAGGAGLYGHQLQNANAPDQLLVADFGNSTSSLNFNFNGANSAGGLKISFDVNSIPTVYAGGSDNWGCINLGASQSDQLVNVNGGQTHFGILFRGAGTLQAFDGAAVVNPNPEPVYSTRPPGTTNHIDLVITDADGNPFDGVGNTTIEVFANGGPLPVWSYTKVGGYANNYINLQGSFRAHVDNLTIEQLPAGSTPAVANSSFEVDNFTVFPGYVSGNGPITGWNALGGHGVNPGVGFGPFTDNGTIPDGAKAAFLQEDGPMTQVVSGFTIGGTYQVRYLENSRNCCGGTPSVEVKIAGQTIVATHTVPLVGGANPYREVLSDSFIATSSAMELSFIKGQAVAGDATLLIDHVSFLASGTSPTITVQPRDTVVALGDTATFTVGAAGSPPLTYQWYFGSDPVFGGDGPSLAVLADFPDAAGEYHVVVANASGTVTSRVARLTIGEVVPGLFNTGVDDSRNALGDAAVDPHYRIVVNPDSISPEAIVENSAAFPIVAGPWVANNAGSKWVGPRFDTTAAAGGDYVYETVFDLGGFDPATLTVSGVWATDNGGLDIIVNGQSTGLRNTAEFQSFTSFTLNSGFAAGLNVIQFKLNNAAVGYTGLRVDMIRGLGQALPAGTQPFIVTQPQGAMLVIGQTASFSVRANGSAPLSYQWYFGPDPIPGATSPSLSFPIEFQDSAGDYSVEITNPVGSVRSAVATLVVLAEPVILTQPQNQVVALGDAATFTVSAIGEPPLTYQWLKDGQPIPGAEQASYTIGSVTTADAGTYTVEISNFSGSVTSSGATLNVAERIPGLFNTGVDAAGAILADAEVDPHYAIVLNPDSASPDAIVENSAAFPIVAGPWVANGPDSKWIGPRFDTTGAAGAEGAGGDYVYRTTFDLGGFDPATVRLSGEWSTDNGGLDILINGVGTGQANTVQFTAYTPFTVNSGFQAGINTLEFRLNNSAVGYTGLRVNGLRAVGARVPIVPNQAPSFVKGPDIAVLENSGPQVFANWATAISAGPGETGQTLTFLVSSDNASLFTAGPAISSSGTLTLSAAPNVTGQANVTVRLQDNGGTDNGGVDTSAPQTFVIRVTPSNSTPTARLEVSPLYPANGLEFPTVISANGTNACLTLDGSASSDPEGDALEFAWLLDGSVIPVAVGAVATVCVELGQHDITLVVTDAGDASDTEVQRIEVITAGEAVDVLIEAVSNSNLERNKRPYVASLKAAQASFDRGNLTSGVNQLRAFQNKVQSLVGRSQPALAAYWIGLAQAIIDAVAPPAAP